MRKLIQPPSPRTRTLVDPQHKSPQRETPDGRPPEPTTHRSYRRIVGIQPGELVRVRGDRDGKYVVVSPPESEKRWQGRKVTTVELLGPGGLVTVPLRFCTPYHP